MAKGSGPDYNPRLKALILQVVDNQMNDPAAPYVRETYDRLMAAGHTDQQTRELIGSAAIGEIYDVMKENQPFNEARYLQALDALK